MFSDTSKLQNPSRKQSVSRSLKHLFNSSNKFVKTLKRFVPQQETLTLRLTNHFLFDYK